MGGKLISRPLPSLTSVDFDLGAYQQQPASTTTAVSLYATCLIGLYPFQSGRALHLTINLWLIAPVVL